MSMQRIDAWTSGLAARGLLADNFARCIEVGWDTQVSLIRGRHNLRG
jgi:hypothetical protein